MRGRLRCIGLLYCVLAGALEWGRFIDRFEWGEVCICTLCAMKYEGGVSNGMWDAKSDGVHKTRTPQNDGDADDQGGWRNGDVTGVGYMRSHESGETMDTKWFKPPTRRAVSR